MIDEFFAWLRKPSDSMPTILQRSQPLRLPEPVTGVSATLHQTQRNLKMAVELAGKVGDRLDAKEKELAELQKRFERVMTDRRRLVASMARVNELLHSDKGVALKALPQRRVQEIRKAVKAAFAASANCPH